MNTPNLNPSRELMGCPFCGGEATYQWHSSPECWIECQTCFAVGPNDKDTTTEQHVVGWNTRALSQTLPAPGEVPEGMKPWTGGDAAPVDWDGGPVTLRNGSTMFPSNVSLAYHANGTDRWNHQRENRNRAWDIIAYSTALATVAAANDEGVADEVTLAQCPPGLFWAGKTLGFKSEYGNNEGRIDAFIISSGEFLWGPAPQTIARQRMMLVRPIDSDHAESALATSRSQHEGASS